MSLGFLITWLKCNGHIVQLVMISSRLNWYMVFSSYLHFFFFTSLTAVVAKLPTDTSLLNRINNPNKMLRCHAKQWTNLLCVLEPIGMRYPLRSLPRSFSLISRHGSRLRTASSQVGEWNSTLSPRSGESTPRALLLAVAEGEGRGGR